ncbi:PepSY-associated TM helix domain-containing protein [Catellatospora sp. KI3]|uniref:PepSY-associated TM helix domain-containing protein n=1 Tax=Catellatospora sp. KI3 TaxID=3041620 RepID=UPI0024827194|nr:PepSY-associated TM helix domain-containing protein [Catellatospora sp. KI3]MDI1460880.1 PepSY-associated TM helix domain-containing protein [Catellatospora sp. KI3]
MSTAVQAPPTSPAETPTAEPRGTLQTGLGPLLRRLHFYAGILVAPFLLALAVTGLAYAFSPQVDQIAYHDQLYVDTVGTTAVPLSQQVAAARAAVPDGTLVAVHPAAAPDATTKVEFALPELGDKQRTAYIDPYTGRLRGILTTWFGATSATTWLDQMHSNLNLGEPGRVYSELAASWLWVLVLGGLILWWRHHHARRTARRLLLPDTAARAGVRRTRSWHATTGLWAAAVLLFLSATGLTWSQYAGANFGWLRGTLNSDSVALNLSLDNATAPPDEHSHHGGTTGGGAADFDAIAASAAAVNLTGPLTITPGEQGRAWTVEQVDNVWPVHRDKIAVHPLTGQVVDTVAWDRQPLLSKLTTFGIQAHMGVLFGLANQLALAAVALALIAVIGRGYRMWWRRRPTRARWKLGSPPQRGTWRLPRPAATAAVVAAAAAVGFAIPLLGLSLLAFLLVDLAAGAVARLRPTRSGAGG